MVLKLFKFILFFTLISISFLAHAAVIEQCDRNVNFNNGNTTKNISGIVNCTWRKNTSIKTKSVTFKNGKKHGKSITYGGRYGRKDSAKNNIAMIENYRDGKKHGKYIIYDDKTPSIIKTERDYQNGLLLRETSLISYSGGKNISFYEIYEKKRNTKIFKRSKKIGSLSYNKAGQLKNKSCPKTVSNIIELNKVCGFSGSNNAVTLRDDKGNVTSTSVINKGHTQENKTFYPSGKLRSKATPNLQQTFYENGKLKQERMSNAGGTLIQKKYYPSGKPQSMERFENRLLTEERNWYMNGKLKYVETFHANTRRKTIESYYGNGQLEERYTSARNKRNARIFVGGTKSYYQNGKNRREANYNNEGKLLQEKFYYDTGKLMKLTQVHGDDSRSIKTYHKHGGLKQSASYYPDGSIK